MPRRVVLLTVGTRGDVQPVISLGLGLQAAGYAVRLVAPTNFASWIASHGLEVECFNIDFEALLRDQEVLTFIEKSMWIKIREGRRLFRRMYEAIIEGTLAHTKDADAILFHPKIEPAVDVAESLRIPAVMFAFQPMTKTGDFPFLIIPYRSLGRWLNRRSYDLIRVLRSLFVGPINELRVDRLGLPRRARFADPFAVGGKPVPVLYAISPTVFPKPSDWPASAHLTGYWFLDESDPWSPSASLAAFLEAGPKPLYVGFGSMPSKDPKAQARLLIEALEHAGQRAVMAKGWGGLDPSEFVGDGTHVHVIDNAPHTPLFPLLAGVVHHGGAGTTAAGLRAGLPALICPILADQPWWSRTIADLGVGPEPLAPKRWTLESLSERLKLLRDEPAYARNAQAIAKRIASEHGVANAVAAIRKIVGDP